MRVLKELPRLLMVVMVLAVFNLAACTTSTENDPPQTSDPATNNPPSETSPPQQTSSHPTSTAPQTTPTVTRSQPATTHPSSTPPVTSITSTQTPGTTTTAPVTTNTAPVTTTTAPVTTTTQTEVTVTQPPATTKDPYSYYRGYLLEGYPEDIWPLYESVGIESCSLSVHYPAYNNIYSGYSNSYSVVYKSIANKADIVEHYLELLPFPQESSWYDAIGVIDGYTLSVRVDDGRSPADVYISVGLPDDSGMTSNPLMTGFPESQFPLYEVNETWAEIVVVNSNPPAGEQFSEIYFSHTGTASEALGFYRGLFAGAEGYKEVTVEEWQGEEVTLSGNIHGYNFQIAVGVWGNSEIIQVRLAEPLKLLLRLGI
jgi:hypothetical protein